MAVPSYTLAVYLETIVLEVEVNEAAVIDL